MKSLSKLLLTNLISRYADILAGKLQQKVTSVEKMQLTRKLLKEKIEAFKVDKLNLQPLIGKLTDQAKFLQDDVSQTCFASNCFPFQLNTFCNFRLKMTSRRDIKIVQLI